MIDFESEIKGCREVRRRLEQTYDLLRSLPRINLYQKVSSESQVSAKIAEATRKVEEALREVIEKERQLKKARDQYISDQRRETRGIKEQRRN